MTEIVERVARALRNDDMTELDRLRAEARSHQLTQKVDLDCRELIWFKENRGWVPPEGANIDRWLRDMRERDEALELDAKS